MRTVSRESTLLLLLLRTARTYLNFEVMDNLESGQCRVLFVTARRISTITQKHSRPSAETSAYLGSDAVHFAPRADVLLTAAATVMSECAHDATQTPHLLDRQVAQHGEVCVQSRRDILEQVCLRHLRTHVKNTRSERHRWHLQCRKSRRHFPGSARDGCSSGTLCPTATIKHKRVSANTN